jgi:hypothetical protein
MKKQTFLISAISLIMIGGMVLWSCTKEEAATSADQTGTHNLKAVGDQLLWDEPVCEGVEHEYCLTFPQAYKGNGDPKTTNGQVQLHYDGDDPETPEIEDGYWLQIANGDGNTEFCFDYTFDEPGDYLVRFKASDQFQETTITVSEDATIALTSAEGTDAQELCVNTPITDITYSIGGGGTGANVTGLPIGVVGIYDDGVFTITGTPTETGTFNYTVQTEGPCVVPYAEGTITVNDCGCEESFSYTDNLDGTYTFTYTPEEDMETVLVEFTFAQGLVIEAPEGFTQPGQGHVRQIEMNFEACMPVSWTFDLSANCTGVGQTYANIFTDFKVGGVSKKGDVGNITMTCQ